VRAVRVTCFQITARDTQSAHTGVATCWSQSTRRVDYDHVIEARASDAPMAHSTYWFAPSVLKNRCDVMSNEDITPFAGRFFCVLGVRCRYRPHQDGVGGVHLAGAAESIIYITVV